jgi:hypothetical protein
MPSDAALHKTIWSSPGVLMRNIAVYFVGFGAATYPSNRMWRAVNRSVKRVRSAGTGLMSSGRNQFRRECVIRPKWAGATRTRSARILGSPMSLLPETNDGWRGVVFSTTGVIRPRVMLPGQSMTSSWTSMCLSGPQ